jgi:GNAT superfamily N-acetyltransferase
VSQLWVAEAARGAGLGSLLFKAAEAEALKRQCDNAHLETCIVTDPKFWSIGGQLVSQQLLGPAFPFVAHYFHGLGNIRYAARQSHWASKTKTSDTTSFGENTPSINWS